MDIELLKTFLEVKNTRHFGKAAENLYLTQAAVSARVKQLERVLGAPLFTRYRNNLQLTATGERLVSHAEGILIAWERARQDVSLKKVQKHSISFGANSGLWDIILQDALNRIHANMDQIALRAEAHGEDVLVRRLMERTMDLALVYEPTKISDLLSVPVYSAELVLVSNNPDATVESAMNNGYVSIDWGISSNITLAQYFPDAAPSVVSTPMVRIALEFILLHGGSAYLPSTLIAKKLGEKLFQLQDAPVIHRPIYAVYHKENRYTCELEQVVQIIREIGGPLPIDLESFVFDQAILPIMDEELDP